MLGRFSRYFIATLQGIFSNVPIYWINTSIWLDKGQNPNPNIAIGMDINSDVMPVLVEQGKVKVFYQEGLWRLDIGDHQKLRMARESYENDSQAQLRKLA